MAEFTLTAVKAKLLGSDVAKISLSWHLTKIGIVQVIL